MSNKPVVGWIRGHRLRFLSRSTNMMEQTRRIFFCLAVASLVFVFPPMLHEPRSEYLPLGVACCAVLLLSWVLIRAINRVPVAVDVVASVAFLLLVQALPTPLISLAVMSGSLWLCGLYGASTVRALLRSTLYSLALVAGVTVWPFFHDSAPLAEPGLVLGAIPTLFLTVLIVRPLSIALRSREQAMQRDRELAATGTSLLGTVDAAGISAIGRAGLEKLCAATPGLRVLQVVRDGPFLRVDGIAGAFLAPPGSLPGDTFAVGPDAVSAKITNPRALDATVGTKLAWDCLGPEGGDKEWILIGAPKAIPEEALVSVRALTNQVALAMRNSIVQQQLVAQATRDSLTGLDNRASFSTKLTALLADVEGSSELHVLFLDLDDFKDVNDMLGHRAGNDLLIAVAERMGALVRPGDVCARLGGDEFAVILTGIDAAGALKIAHRLGAAIAEPVHFGVRTARVGVSVGVVAATPGIDIEDLVHRADVAMYAAKANGKNRVQTYNPRLEPDASQKRSELQHAAAGNPDQLFMDYRPTLVLPSLRGATSLPCSRFQTRTEQEGR